VRNNKGHFHDPCRPADAHYDITYRIASGIVCASVWHSWVLDTERSPVRLWA